MAKENDKDLGVNKNKGPYWNEELQSWEFPNKGSIDYAVVQYFQNPNPETHQAYLDAMNRTIEEEVNVARIGRG